MQTEAREHFRKSILKGLPEGRKTPLHYLLASENYELVPSVIPDNVSPLIILFFLVVTIKLVLASSRYL